MTSKELEANVQKDMPDIRVIEQLATSLFPRSYRPCVERVEEGVSTYVYRIYFANEQFYLRILLFPGGRVPRQQGLHLRAT